MTDRKDRQDSPDPLDPLASPTLAQLYLAQGLHARAGAVLHQLRERGPEDGAVLALLRRLHIRAGAVLSVDVSSASQGLVRVDVRAPEGRHGLLEIETGSVVVASWPLARRSPWITSRRVAGAETVDIPIPRAPHGVVTACLVGGPQSTDEAPPKRRLDVRAVAEVQAW
jgi:hypothetical protein